MGSLTGQSTYRHRFAGDRGLRCVGRDTFASCPRVTRRSRCSIAANPVVRAVLRSPLHPLLSRSLALITVTGRRSGRRHPVPVGYRRHGDRVLINVGWPERKHWCAT